MARGDADPTAEFTVDRPREECHLDDEGYLHTDTVSAHPDTIIITYE